MLHCVFENDETTACGVALADLADTCPRNPTTTRRCLSCVAHVRQRAVNRLAPVEGPGRWTGDVRDWHDVVGMLERESIALPSDDVDGRLERMVAILAICRDCLQDEGMAIDVCRRIGRLRPVASPTSTQLADSHKTQPSMERTGACPRTQRGIAAPPSRPRKDRERTRQPLHRHDARLYRTFEALGQAPACSMEVDSRALAVVGRLASLARRGAPATRYGR